MAAPKSFSKTATDAYNHVEALGLTDPGQVIDAVVRFYAEKQGITDERTVADLSGVIQRVAQWESGFRNIRAQAGPWYGWFQNDMAVGRGAGYSEEELLDPITNTIIAVEELLPLANTAYGENRDIAAAGWSAVVEGQRPLGSQTLRGLEPLAGETDEDAERVRAMAAFAGDTTVEAQNAPPPPPIGIWAKPHEPEAGEGGGDAGPDFGVDNRSDYMAACVGAGNGSVQCSLWADARFPKEEEEEGLTASDRYVMREWNQNNPDRKVTAEEVKAAKELWPDVPVIAAIRKFVEGAGVAAEEGEEAVKATDEDRRIVLEAGLGLSDTDIRNAKLLKVSFEDYAILKQIASALDTQPGVVLQRARAGETLEDFQREIAVKETAELVHGARPGTTQAEAQAYAEAAVQAGFAPEEAQYAYGENVPVDTLGRVKRERDQLAQTMAAGDVPTVEEILQGYAEGRTAAQVAEWKTFQREHAYAYTQMSDRDKRLARALGHGDLWQGYLRLQEVKARQIQTGETTETFARRRFQEDATSREVARDLERQVGREGMPAMMRRLTEEERLGAYNPLARGAFTVFGREMVAGLREAPRTFGIGMTGRGRSETAAEQLLAQAPRYGPTTEGEMWMGQKLREAFISRGPTGIRSPSERIRVEERQQELRRQFPGLTRSLEEEQRSTALGTEDPFTREVPPETTMLSEDEQKRKEEEQLRRIGAAGAAAGGARTAGGVTFSRPGLGA